MRDSLTGGALPGATVHLVPAASVSDAGELVAADSGGRFRFLKVPPGRYLLGALHPRLDSLGLAPPTRAVDVAAGADTVRVELAGPSAGTIARAVCGPPRTPADSTGALLGRVLDAERGAAVLGGIVEVRWRELRVDERGVRSTIERVRAAVSPAGRYAACGVPTNAVLLVQALSVDSAPVSGLTAPLPGGARQRALSSGAIELRFAPQSSVRYRDLLVASEPSIASGDPARPAPESASTAAARPPAIRGRRGTSRLVGHVRGPTGAPLAGARVVLREADATDSVAVTDGSGAYGLGALPGGTHPVAVFALGYAPLRAAADLRAGQTATLDVTLDRAAPTLPTVSVYAAPPRANHEFARRRRSGAGYFLTAADIATRRPRFVGDALTGVGGLRVADTRFGRPVIAGPRGCTPSLWLDGIRLATTALAGNAVLGTPQAALAAADGGTAALDSFVRPEDIGGVEVYTDPLRVPAQFGGCAAIVVWTKAALM